MTSQEYKAKFDPQMQEFCEKNGIHFYPWIGADYCNSQPKILLLGESYYLDEWNPEGRFDWDITKDASPLAIRKYLGEEPTNNYKVITKEFITHDKATRVILGITGRRVSLEERRILWHSVAYTVFIQNSFRKKVADSSAFEKGEIEKDTIILDAILAKYKPDLVISYSNSIQKQIASNPQIVKVPRNAQGETLTCYLWKRSGIQFMGIPHPSILRSNMSIMNLHSLYLSLFNQE